MEKQQYDLCVKVLDVLHTSGALKHIILIGSWAMKMYGGYFNSGSYTPVIQTRDIDFLVPTPVRITGKVNVQEILAGLGFIMSFTPTKGYVKFEHPDLIVEFLVPERGRGMDRPYEIPQLGVNAVALRYLDFLVDHVMTIDVEGMKIKVPHPAAYALHKFIIFGRRRKKDKRDRDLEGALRVLNELIKHKKQNDIKKIFRTMHKKWQKTVIDNLLKSGEEDSAGLLAGFIAR